MKWVIVSALVAVVLAVYWALRPRRGIVNQGFVGLLIKSGRFVRELPPGGYWLFREQSISSVDMRQRVSNMGTQELLTSDNISVKLTLTFKFQVKDAVKASFGVANYWDSLYQATQIHLRQVIAAKTAEELLSLRFEALEDFRKKVVDDGAALGLLVEGVELRDIILPAELKKAFSEILRAKKEGEATLERTRSQQAALRNLANAARLLEKNPDLLRLRMLDSVDLLGKGSGKVVLHLDWPEADKASTASPTPSPGAHP